MTRDGDTETIEHARALHEVSQLLAGAGLARGGLGVPLLVAAWKGIPAADRRADAVRALAAALRVEAERLGDGVLGRWWGPAAAGDMMLLDRRLVDRLRELGDAAGATAVEATARKRWAVGAVGERGAVAPWLVRLARGDRDELATLARVVDVDPETGRVEAGAGPDGLTWVWLWNEAVRRGRVSAAAAVAAARTGDLLHEDRVAPELRDAVRALDAEIVAAAGDTTARNWIAPRWIALAGAVWPAVKAVVERRRERARVAPLVVVAEPLFDPLLTISTASLTGRRYYPEDRPPRLALHADERVRVGRNRLALVARGEAELLIGLSNAETRPYFWPVVHWIVSETRRRWLDGEVDPHVLQHAGGYDGIRRAMGLTASEAAERVRDVLRLLHVLGMRSPGEGGLLTLRETEDRSTVTAKGGRPRKIVTIEVGLALRPDAPAARRLWGGDAVFAVPLIDPRRLPEHGNRATRAAQRTLAQRLSLYGFKRRVELAGEGGFRMTRADFVNEANLAGLYPGQRTTLHTDFLDALLELAPPVPPPLLAEVEDTAPPVPLLTRVAPDMYRFTDDDTHNALVTKGELSVARAESGRRSVEARAAALDAPADKGRGRKRG